MEEFEFIVFSFILLYFEFAWAFAIASFIHVFIQQIVVKNLLR